MVNSQKIVKNKIVWFLVVMIVICIVIWFVWPKTIVFGWVKIVVDSKHVIHKMSIPKFSIPMAGVV